MSMERVVKALAPAVTLIAERLDRRFRWGRLPRRLGILTLIGLRNRLRERTLDGRGIHPTHPEIGAARMARSTPSNGRRHCSLILRPSGGRRPQPGTRASIRPGPFSGPMV
jgi:hypothetical protein